MQKFILLFFLSFFFMQPHSCLSSSTPFSSPYTRQSYDQSTQNNSYEKDLSDITTLSQASEIVDSHQLSSYFLARTSSALTESFETWLDHYGNAQIQLDFDSHGRLNHSNSDYLIPLYDNHKSVLFFQSGFRNPDKRKTLNLGFGVRTFWLTGWMYGINFFSDNDLTGHNRRFSIGAEAWRDWLQLSANTYIAKSDWHATRDFDSPWQEKPANGWDIRAQGWLPEYPQLGAKLMLERYYGDKVALFNKDHLQHNPYALSFGINYTPIPLLTFSLDQTQNNEQHDTELSVNFNWRLGESLQWNTDPRNINITHILQESRYDFVKRNNNIILQYRKNPALTVAHLSLLVIKDNSPADGLSQNVFQVVATNADGKPVPDAHIKWSSSGNDGIQLTPSTSLTNHLGIATALQTSSLPQTVQVKAQSAEVSITQDSHFLSQSAGNIDLKIIQDNAQADGISEDVVKATLTDSRGKPISHGLVNWQTPDNVQLSDVRGITDIQGEAFEKILSHDALKGIIVASANNLNKSVKVHFIRADGTQITINASKSAMADGKDQIKITVLMRDRDHQPIQGETIAFSASGHGKLSSQSEKTDILGTANIFITDDHAEPVNVTASTVSGKQVSAVANFINYYVTALSSDADSVKANGTENATLTATVKDNEGNLIIGTPVSFSTTGRAILSAKSARTDATGKAHVSLSDTTGETVSINAHSEINTNDTGKSISVIFTPPKITGILVTGTEHSFGVDSGFPRTGFDGAQMSFYIDGSTETAKNFSWTSDSSWAKVNAETGVVTFNSKFTPSKPKVTITAYSNNGWNTLVYTFTIQNWYTPVEAYYSDVQCLSGTLPSSSELTSGTTSVVGKLLGEWRDSPALHSYGNLIWDKETAESYQAGGDITFVLYTGLIMSSSTPSERANVMCRNQ